jgi:hypothetical protein
MIDKHIDYVKVSQYLKEFYECDRILIDFLELEGKMVVHKHSFLPGGKIGGKTSYEKGVGFFALSTEELYNIRKNAGKQGSKITNSQKWMCLETGFITTSGALTRYQQKRNIDTSKRKRIS